MNEPIAFENVARGDVFSTMWWVRDSMVLEQLCIKDGFHDRRFSIIATRTRLANEDVATHFSEEVSNRRHNSGLDFSKFEKENENQGYDIRCFPVSRDDAKQWIMDWKREQPLLEMGREILRLIDDVWTPNAHIKSGRKAEMIQVAFEVDNEFRYPGEERYRG